MVAAAKLKRAQDNIIKIRPYAGKLKEIMEDVSQNMGEGFETPYAAKREAKNVLVIVITSNRGLCGGFNSGIIKHAIKHIEENYADQRAAGNVKLLCVGKKGFEFFGKRDFSLEGENHDVFADLTFNNAADVIEQVMEDFINEKYDVVDIAFNEFKNVVVQNRMVESFLPISTESHEGAGQVKDYIFEPEKDEILQELIPKSLKIQFYRAVLESNAGEQGARMTAMDNATNNAEELLKELKLIYNRARQAAITTEILEIVGGANALENG